MKTFSSVIATILAVFSLSSCASKISVDGEWAIKSVEGETVQTTEQAPYLVFNEDEGTVHGFLGVNLLNGNYTLKGSKLSFQHLGTTMMSGLPQDMDIVASNITCATYELLEDAEERDPYEAKTLLEKLFAKWPKAFHFAMRTAEKDESDEDNLIFLCCNHLLIVQIL